jgi:hypothetical protein
MNPPDYNLDKIKFATDGPTFERAVSLYEDGKVTRVEEGIRSYTSVVFGTKPYKVSVEARRYDYGHCTCYLGANGTLCKHMVALAIYVVQVGRPLTDQDKKLVHTPVCSNKVGVLSNTELDKVKQTINSALHYIKAYTGPSRTWFTYQASLFEGCNRLAAIIAGLPVSLKTTELLVDLLLRLDKKLSTGRVDDSDGEVGGFMEEVVAVLLDFVKLDPNCVKAFNKLKDRKTCFEWEEPLLKSEV